MSTVTIRAGHTTTKREAERKTYLVDWNSDSLADGAVITASDWIITPIAPSSIEDVTPDDELEADEERVMTGSRSTAVRLSGGTPGQTYEIANRIVTSESPAQ